MKSLIWNWPSRLFHQLLTLGIIVVFITGDEENLRSLHIAAGTFSALLILLRLVYGVFGPKYSHFRDFNFSLAAIKEYFVNYLSSPKVYPGHNPAASVAMVLILLLGLASGITGYLLYGVENNALALSMGKDSLKELHEGIAHLFLGFVVLHLIGVIADAIFHKKTGTLVSIFNGYKTIEAEESKLSGLHKAYAVFWILIPIISFYLAFNLPIKDSGEKEKDKIEKTEEH